MRFLFPLLLALPGAALAHDFQAGDLAISHPFALESTGDNGGGYLTVTNAGAEPDVRKVMVGSRRVPYYQGGPAYRPYAMGYFGAFGPMDWMFMGLMFGAFDGLGEGLGSLAEGIGDGVGGLFEGVGDLFDGFDF